MPNYGYMVADGNRHVYDYSNAKCQEVESIFPWLVSTDSDSGIMGVNYNGFIPILIEAIKEQEATIQKDGAKIQELEARIEKLEQIMTNKIQQ